MELRNTKEFVKKFGPELGWSDGAEAMAFIDERIREMEDDIFVLRSFRTTAAQVHQVMRDRDNMKPPGHAFAVYAKDPGNPGAYIPNPNKVTPGDNVECDAGALIKRYAPDLLPAHMRQTDTDCASGTQEHPEKHENLM